jgi:hypothetical protein
MTTLNGKHIVNIKNSEGEEVPYELIIIPEKAKRPTVAVHGAEANADRFVAANDTVKRGQAEQASSKATLLKVARQVRDAATASDSDIPETVRFATDNGRSVTVTAKYKGAKLDTDLYKKLKVALTAEDFNKIVEESVSLKIDLGKKTPKHIARVCKKALENIVTCEEVVTYKANSGMEIFKLVEELLDSAGEDVDLVEALTALRAELQPGFDTAVSTKIPTAKY